MQRSSTAQLALLHQPCSLRSADAPWLKPRLFATLQIVTCPVAPTLPRNRVPYVQPERMFLLLNAYLENKPLQRATKAQVSKG